MEQKIPYLSSEVIGRARNLYIKAREIAGTFYSGIQKSKVKGRGTDFVEYRLYSHGDDLRNLDWKVFARLDKLYVKKREDPSRVDIVIILDDSLSMHYGNGFENKFEFTRVLCATIAYISIEQGDRVGLFTFSRSVSVLPSASEKTFYDILIILSEITPSSKIPVTQSLENLISLLKKNSKVIIVSDLLGSGSELFEQLKILKGIKCEIDVIRVLTENEIFFKFNDEAKFIDPETGEMLIINPTLIRKAYCDNLKKWDEVMKEYFYNVRGRYITANTKEKIEKVLLSLTQER